MLTVRGFELWTAANDRFRIRLVEGFDELPEFDGENTVIVGKPGEIDEEQIARRRYLKFDGWINGQGASLAARRADYRVAVGELREAIAPQTAGILDGPGAVVVDGPMLGIPTGDQYTIDAKYLSAMWGQRVAQVSRHVIFTMVCVADPPEWTLVP